MYDEYLLVCRSKSFATDTETACQPPQLPLQVHYRLIEICTFPESETKSYRHSSDLTVAAAVGGVAVAVDVRPLVEWGNAPSRPTPRRPWGLEKRQQRKQDCLHTVLVMIVYTDG